MPRDHFAEHDRDFIPALSFHEPEELKAMFDDPRVQRRDGENAYDVDIDGERYTIREVAGGQLADLPAGWAVFDSAGVWLGDKELRRTDRVVAQWVYPSETHALLQVFTKPAWIA